MSGFTLLITNNTDECIARPKKDNPAILTDKCMYYIGTRKCNFKAFVTWLCRDSFALVGGISTKLVQLSPKYMASAL